MTGTRPEQTDGAQNGQPQGDGAAGARLGDADKERVRELTDFCFQVDSLEQLSAVPISVFMTTLSYAASLTTVQKKQIDRDGLVQQQAFAIGGVVAALKRARSLDSLQRMAERNVQWYLDSVMASVGGAGADGTGAASLRQAMVQLESLVYDVVDKELTRAWADLPLIRAELDGADRPPAQSERDLAAEQLRARKQISTEKAERAGARTRKAATDVVETARRVVARRDEAASTRRCLNPECEAMTVDEMSCCSNACEEALDRLARELEQSADDTGGQGPADRPGASSAVDPRRASSTTTPAGLIWSLSRPNTLTSSTQAQDLHKQFVTCDFVEIDFHEIVKLCDILVANYTGADGPVDPKMILRYVQESSFTNVNALKTLDGLLEASPHSKHFLNRSFREKFLTKLEAIVKDRDSDGYMNAGALLMKVMQQDYEKYANQMVKIDRAKASKKDQQQEEMYRMLSGLAAGRGGGRRGRESGDESMCEAGDTCDESE
jgi:hypothetical protein